jgi:putative transposase
MIEALRKVIKRMHYPVEVMLTCVRWYVAYPLSLRHIEEMMAERGVFVDHATVHRWSLKILPALAKAFPPPQAPVGKSWHMDETYMKICSCWWYLYRAVDRDGDMVDFLLTAHRDEVSARVFSSMLSVSTAGPRRSRLTGAALTLQPSAVTRPSMRPASRRGNANTDNNLVERDHRVIRRITRRMLGFKFLRCARTLLADIETMHTIRKGQLATPNRRAESAAEQFCSLVY